MGRQPVGSCGSADSPCMSANEILADLRHFCDRHGLCFGDLDRTAYQHYLAELGEKRHGT